MNYLKNDIQVLAKIYRDIFYIPTWEQFICTFTKAWLARHPGVACFWVCGLVDGLLGDRWISLDKDVCYRASLLKLYVGAFNFIVK